MATSGSTTFTFTVDEMVDEALDRCGGEPQLGNEPVSARRSLNLILTDWQNRGVNLWTVESNTLDMVDGTASYTLPSDTIDVLEAVLRRSSVDTPMERISYNEYLNRPTKSTEGKPIQYMIERNPTNTKMVVWPTAENSTDDVVYWQLRVMETVTAATETVDVQRRFYPALVSGLAYEMAKKRFPNDDNPDALMAHMRRIQMLKADYEEDFLRAAGEDRDRASLWITPYKRYR